MRDLVELGEAHLSEAADQGLVSQPDVPGRLPVTTVLHYRNDGELDTLKTGPVDVAWYQSHPELHWDTARAGR